MDSRGETIGWIGLGTMGEPMARRLASDGRRMAVWNRSAGKAEAFARSAEAGRIVAAATPREVGERCARVVLMLASPEALDAVLEGADGLLAGLRPGDLVVDMATDGVETVLSLERRVRERGASVLDAPVLGSRGPAEQGTLLVMAGGAAADVERATDLLGPLSRGVQRTGAVGLARAQGVDAETLVSVLEAGLGSPYFRVKGLQMIRDEMAPQFTLRLMRKDLDLIARAALQAGFDWPTLGPIRELGEEAARRGWDDLDGACIARLALPAPGR
jgi:3-hydroxyisobutyrate dehydrogenase-like beta-hydroxyacid dehydrogenase